MCWPGVLPITIRPAIEDETVLRGDLFSEVLHRTRVLHSREHCLLHLSIGLPMRDEEKFAESLPGSVSDDVSRRRLSQPATRKTHSANRRRMPVA